MATIRASGCKFTQFMANHVLRDVDRNVSPPIMHGNRVADHLGEDRARSTPGANHLLLTTLIHDLDLFQKFGGYKGPLLQ